MPGTEPFERYVDAYDAWFEQHPAAYASELEAVRTLLPRNGLGIEVGAGTGRFAQPLGITVGVEPAGPMRDRAEQRGLRVVPGVAEALPFDDEHFDYALMVTVDCFLDDLAAAFAEVHRLLRPGGTFVIGLIDRASPLGRHYERHKEASPFYRDARFHSAEEIAGYMEAAGFDALTFRQTLFGDPARMETPDAVEEGHGRGAFVAIRGVRPL